MFILKKYLLRLLSIIFKIFFIAFTLFVFISAIFFIVVFYKFIDLGHIKLKGEGSKEVWLLQRAASRGDVVSLMRLAKLYQETLEEEKIAFHSISTGAYYQKICELCEVAAKQGNPEAQYKVADCYYTGYGFPKDEDIAVKWLHKAIAQDFLKAKLRLARVYENLGRNANSKFFDLKKSFYWNEQASKQGSPIADYRLGMSYYKGEGVARDYKNALFYLDRAATANNRDAQVALGNFYEDCNISFCDDVKARYWYEKAAYNNERVAQYQLGVFYEKGRGGSQDYEKAKYWYQQAEDWDFEKAELALGRLYKEGKGGARNYKEAMIHYDKATAHINPVAEYNMGLLYEIDKNQILADSYFKRAFNAYKTFDKQTMDDDLRPEVEYTMGNLYYYGRGVTQNINQAISWWTISANHGCSSASLALGRLYSQNIETPKNLVKAKIWLEKALEQGDLEVKQLLIKLSEK